MINRGKLIVFEGPDGVGKSTLSHWLVDELKTSGITSLYFAFPGKQKGTLGHHIYDLHHKPAEFGILADINPTSLQLLHVAAHVTAIENEIVPALNQGTWVVLDRFWWSTWVYGLVNGINESTLQKILSVEHEYWNEIYPDIAFLIERSASLKDEEPPEKWHKLHNGYSDIALRQSQYHPVEIIKNNENLSLATQQVLQKCEQMFEYQIA